MGGHERPVTTLRAVLALLIVLSSCPLALAQSTGRIRGVVTDEQGAVLPGATVLVRNQNTQETRDTVTDASGEFLLPALLVGMYRVEVQLQGSRTQVVTS